MPQQTENMKRPARGEMKKKTAKRRRKNTGAPKQGQTHEPFEQDAKRRIGQFGGTGEPPIKK